MSYNIKMTLQDTQKGGKPARLGFKFVDEMREIKKERLNNGNSKDLISTEKITNLITKHSSWGQMKKDIIEAPEEEFNKHEK